MHVIHIITFCCREIGKRAGIKDKEKLTAEQYILCMIFLHCNHYFRLGGLRKSTEMNCKMEVIEMRGILLCKSERFLWNLPHCGVTYQYWQLADTISRRRSINHADCRLTVTSSQCGDRKLHTFSCAVVYQWTVTVWHNLHTALYVALHTHTHTHTNDLT